MIGEAVVYGNVNYDQWSWISGSLKKKEIFHFLEEEQEDLCIATDKPL